MVDRCASSIEIVIFRYRLDSVFRINTRIADVEFGRNAEKQVVDFAEGLSEVLLILFVPGLLSGLIMFLVYSAQCSQEGAETAQDQ